ncbi:hypothetical protein A3N37_18150 [Enterobacter ludwigii]|nr:hypothetical protein A3N37_18150 [Enterobacter ludwigii]
MKDYFTQSTACLIIYIVYLYFEYRYLKTKNGFSMNEQPLSEQLLFKAAVRVPLISFIFFGWFAWSGHPPSFTSKGFSNFIERGKLPLGLLSLSIPFLAVINNIHRTIQTDAQIKESKKKNLSDLFYSHQKNTIEYFSTHVKYTMTAGNVQQNSHEERLIKVKHAYKLYQKLFPNSSPSNNDFTLSEKYIESIKLVWVKIDSLLNEDNYKYIKNKKRYYKECQAKNIYSLELCIRKLIKKFYLDDIKFKYTHVIHEYQKYKLVTGIQNEDDLKNIIKYFWLITNDISLIGNEVILKKIEYPNIERYLISKQGYTHLERHKGWESESVFVQNLTTIYKPLFIAFPRNE